MHPYSARSLGTAPPLTVVRAAGVLGQETAEGISAGGRGSLYVETVFGRSDEPPSCFCQQCGGAGARQWMLVCPPVVAVVCRLVDLRLLLNGGVLAALSGAALSVLLQVVVQNLRVGLLVRCQDVHEGGRGVASGSRGVDGSPAPQSRGQAE